jgi:DNA-binding MarR family transcriptional regulator
MRLIHDVTARSAERTTLDLTIRERLMIQRLGLDGAMPIAALGHRLSVSSSSMTGLVDQLEDKGHLERRPHPTDRRAIDLVLTRKGRAAFNREIAFYRALVDETLTPLGSEAMNLVLRALLALDGPDVDSKDD